MIEMASTPISGNAVLLSLGTPADGIKYSRVLRRTDANFIGANDPDALTVFQGEDLLVADLTVKNGIQYFYKDYGFDGTDFVDDHADPIDITPDVTYQSIGPDVRKILSSRYEAGIKQEIARGLIKVKPPQGKTAATVLFQLAPPAYESTLWPVGVVEFNDDRPGERGIGESIGIGDDAVNGETEESVLENYSLQISVWSQNSDERHEFHEALKRVTLANLAVFNALGFVEVAWSVRDINFLDRTQFAADIYCASLMFTCKAPFGVIAKYDYPVIDAVDVLIATSVVIDGVTTVIDSGAP